MTEVFVEQPLALPGSAKKAEVFCDKTYFLDLGNSCFKTPSEKLNDLVQNRKVAVITGLSQLAKIVNVVHPFMTTFY